MVLQMNELEAHKRKHRNGAWLTVFVVFLLVYVFSYSLFVFRSNQAAANAGLKGVGMCFFPLDSQGHFLLEGDKGPLMEDVLFFFYWPALHADYLLTKRKYSGRTYSIGYHRRPWLHDNIMKNLDDTESNVRTIRRMTGIAFVVSGGFYLLYNRIRKRQ